MNAPNTIKSSLKIGLPMVFNKMTVTLLIIGLAIMGCALLKLEKENARGLASAILVGHVSTDFPGKGPIIVAACAINQGKKKVAHYTMLHDFGEFELMVPKGNYYVFAYWDKNSNLIYDAGELAGQYGGPKMVSAPSGGVVAEINIAIAKNAQNIDIPFGFEISSVQPHKIHSRLAGAIIDLDDSLFLEKHGTKGYWEPFSFFKELGGNIYFVEEYDPKKIPILFIHGATGTPKGWKYFVDSIDRTRFQPWFFYYPSGAPIKSLSNLLYWKLQNLQAKYHFDELYITAHSMGGLVARSFIMDYFARFPYVKLFISLSTPWGGDRMAEYGVKQSPTTIPCWIDMQPESAFIRSLYRTKLPEPVSFYLFYGHRGSRNPFRTNNDGTIALSSLLDGRAQSDSKMSYAFNDDHASIIYSKAALDQYNTIINAYEEKGATAHRSGGYLKVHYSYRGDPVEGNWPRPVLILQPVGQKHWETGIRLGPDDNGRRLGPFPPGQYLASFFVYTAKTGKRYVPVKIENNETGELNFVLTHDGIIAGRVETASKLKGWSAGMQYGDNVTIQSITLKGAGVHRKLHLLEEDVNLWEYLIPRADFCYKGNFFFFGLPVGEFELVIRAQGYKSFEKKCFIKDGGIKDSMIVKLIPE